MNQVDKTMVSGAAADRPILICDGLSLFVRHYMANPAMSDNGELMGGVVGTLSTISKLVRELMPKAIYVVWESGGSPKRRALLPEYKANRKPDRMNRHYSNDIPDSKQNEAEQKIIIVDILKTIPVCQVYVPNCEADDVIGYLARNKFSDRQKVIVSSDKDYYQLLDEKTWIYSPGRKVYIYEADVLNEFNISAQNFCVAKSFCGDVSDNIPGVPRVGFKTLAKRFPSLSTDEPTSVDEILMLNEEALSDKKKSKLKIHNNIHAHADEVRRNWKLMYLDTIMLSVQQIDQVNRFVDYYKPKKNTFQFYKKRRHHQLENALRGELFLSAFSYFRET